MKEVAMPIALVNVDVPLNMFNEVEEEGGACVCVSWRGRGGWFAAAFSGCAPSKNQLSHASRSLTGMARGAWTMLFCRICHPRITSIDHPHQQTRVGFDDVSDQTRSA
jgi:hypothetical protein